MVIFYCVIIIYDFIMLRRQKFSCIYFLDLLLNIMFSLVNRLRVAKLLDYDCIVNSTLN